MRLKDLFHGWKFSYTAFFQKLGHLVPAVRLMLILVLLNSCDSRKIVFEKSLDIAETGWTYADSLNYDFPIADTGKVYGIFLSLRHDKAYPYQNIYLNMHTKFPSGKKLSQRINIDLAEPSGKWNSDCSGNNCSLEIPIQEKAYFNELGKYTLTIEQFLRVDTLRGINSIGLSLEEVGNRQ